MAVRAANQLVANLYAEEAYRSVALECDERPLTGPAREALTVAGALFRILAEDDADELWTIDPIEASRLPELPTVPNVSVHGGAPTPSPSVRYWMLPPTKQLAAWVSREFAHRQEQLHRFRLPGAAFVASWGELRDATKAIEQASRSEQPRWVAKSCYSAAGRDRFWETGNNSSLEALKRWIEHEQGAVVEPWLPRTADYGACGWAGRTTRLDTIHELLNTPRGAFRGVRLSTSAPITPSLTPDDAQRISDTFHTVAEQLVQAGYTGPFGIDAFRYVTPGGETELHTLSEINARWSVGALARRWVDRLRETTLLPADSMVALRLGRGTAPPGAITLTTSDTKVTSSASAWIEPAPGP